MQIKERLEVYILSTNLSRLEIGELEKVDKSSRHHFSSADTP